VPLTLGDHRLELPDGRTLGYTVYGDPDGHVVLSCHGGLVSGHDARPADGPAHDLGLCLVSPDRPGVGRTDRLPGHGLLPWVRADVVPLLEHLDVERCAVRGWSEGGQYALAVAAELGGRVTRCAVVAGCPPLDDQATFADLNRLDRTLAGLARRAPVVARGYFHVVGLTARAAPGALIRSGTRGLPPDEVAAVSAQGRWLSTVLGEGAHQPYGGVDEYRAFVAPWGFRPEDVAVPVRIFQGGADQLVPPAWAKVLADRIPGAELTEYPDGGHFIVLTRNDDVLRYLAGERAGA